MIIGNSVYIELDEMNLQLELDTCNTNTFSIENGKFYLIVEV